MRAFVVGGSGQIGGHLLRSLVDRGHEALGAYATVPYPGLVRLDAADPPQSLESLFEDRRPPDVLFYPAGFTWVDACEREPARAFLANRDQPLHLARLAKRVGARFVYFSTDYVFDGRSGPNLETDSTDPLSIYGLAKREAELALLEELGDLALIARTSWVFGPERQGKNFAYQAVRAARLGKQVVCPADQRSSPSYAVNVARAAIQLVESAESGIWHVAGPETIDRPTFARAILEAFGLDPSLIVSKPTAELGQVAPRPLSGGLRTSKLVAFLARRLRPLADALADFRDRLTLEVGEPWADPRVET